MKAAEESSFIVIDNSVAILGALGLGLVARRWLRRGRRAERTD